MHDAILERSDEAREMDSLSRDRRPLSVAQSSEPTRPLRESHPINPPEDVPDARCTLRRCDLGSSVDADISALGYSRFHSKLLTQDRVLPLGSNPLVNSQRIK
jgi:hypothetical protein